MNLNVTSSPLQLSYLKPELIGCVVFHVIASEGKPTLNDSLSYGPYFVRNAAPRGASSDLALPVLVDLKTGLDVAHDEFDRFMAVEHELTVYMDRSARI